jgi:putative ABC transport system permease protein
MIGRIYPAIPIEPPLWAILAALLTAAGTGIFFGFLPARRAANMDPVTALGHV